MKAITLTQPWATLIVVGAKLIETRSWFTTCRGRIAIHAAKNFPEYAQHLCFREPFRLFLEEYVDLNKTYLGRHRFPSGAIIATCRLVNCFKILDGTYRVGGIHIPPGEPEQSFGDYTPGRYAWILDDVRRLPEPIPARGALGLWEWTQGDEHE